MAATTKPLIGFDRRVSDTLVDALRPGGELRFVLDHPRVAALGVDAQLRSDDSRSWMSMYLGLTSVLNVITTGTKFHLTVHKTHQKAGFDLGWSQPRPLSHLAEQREAIEMYLTKILGHAAVHASHTEYEGRVQAAISTSSEQDFGAFQREAVPTFPSDQLRTRIAGPYRQRIRAALDPDAHRSKKWWPGIAARGVFPPLGLEADLLGLDDRGRLLVIEVKPANAVKGIALAPCQVRLYAEMFALWLETDPAARENIISMVVQRQALDLPAPTSTVPPQHSIRIAPVVSIGPGTMSKKARPRLQAIHAALQSEPSVSARIDPLEVWHHDEHGARVERWLPGC